MLVGSMEWLVTGSYKGVQGSLQKSMNALNSTGETLCVNKVTFQGKTQFPKSLKSS